MCRVGGLRAGYILSTGKSSNSSSSSKAAVGLVSFVGSAVLSAGVVVALAAAGGAAPEAGAPDMAVDWGLGDWT
jgi:hypothetical protein